MQIDGGIRWRGEVTVRTYKMGRLWRIDRQPNLVVNGGRNRFAQLMIGQSTRPITHIAVGTDDTAVQATDTSLGSEVYRDDVTALDNPSTGTLKVRLFISSTNANGNTLREAGLYDLKNAGTLLARVVFETEIEKDNTKSVQISWTISGEAS